MKDVGTTVLVRCTDDTYDKFFSRCTRYARDQVKSSVIWGVARKVNKPVLSGIKNHVQARARLER